MNQVRLGSGRSRPTEMPSCLNHGFIFRSSTALFTQETLTVTTSRTSCVNAPMEREYSPGVTEVVNKDLFTLMKSECEFRGIYDNKTCTQAPRIHISRILSLLLRFFHPSLPIQFNLVISSFFAWVITVRKRSLRRLCFYTCLSVILFTGICLSACWTPPPQEQTPAGSDTPQEQTPPAQCMLEDTANKRAVRILLECILVLPKVLRSFLLSWH